MLPKCYTMLAWMGNIEESGDIMQIGNDIGKVRKDIESLVGQPIVIRCNQGKRRTRVSKGMLESAYPNVFRVKYDETGCNDSFSYVDFANKRVEFLATGEKETKAFVFED